ncbi:FAD-dependent oxidoreductase [[Clostridium] innocuum]|nr:FAD-dependent oxidoreductase [Erysipelotrichaceae bacterium]MCR0380942.1 FAD-dependent oxidoreductase [[Clostridium] innocuum]MCR0411425.1 FAD-dependent oxidoreductase [[Clostridium] innocuum]MCR0534992.1 FAD-dependent oxidoreductase [[Clostridium] innocuum]MCR0538962.1 FAD-dependent oxidoreductase [[Clostridium] innocuum]
MKKEYEALFTPLRIGNVEIRNRFAMAPMAMGQLDDHWAYKQESIDYFTERARGGTGLIITGANFIENRIEKHRKASFPCPLEDPQSYMTQLKKMSDNIHAYNSKLFVQLTAGLGRSAIPAMILDNTFVAPSATTNRWDPSIQHRALTTEEIYELIKDFATCAMLAKMGGADGIEVHAVHEGYLLDNFTMEYFNQREDEFGGDLMGRLRFPLAILQAVKQACGKDFPVILRFSLKSFIRAERHGILPGESYPELGRDIEEGLQFAKILTEAGYDALNVDAGSYDAWYWAHPPFFQDRGLYLPFAEKVKEVVKVPVLTAGRMGYPQLAADAVNEGKCDMVVLGRPLLADPEFVNKMRNGDVQDIRPCLSCHDGCFNRAHSMRLMSCAVNPQCNREKEAAFSKAENTKNCLVIGGGPAGMEAARVLALRGHTVTLVEKENHLGGMYRWASVPEFKDDGKLLISWYEHQMEKLQVQVELNSDVQVEDPRIEAADVVICATGSHAFLPPIKGIEYGVTAVDVLKGTVSAKKETTIIGGGLVGCELAIWLSQHGSSVRIVEMADKLMSTGAPADMNKQMIMELLEHHQVDIRLQTKLQEIREHEIVVEAQGTIQELASGCTILALGYRSNHSLYDQILLKAKDIYNIGDSSHPKDIMEGIWDAYELCSHL